MLTYKMWLRLLEAEAHVKELQQKFNTEKG